jgi:hypothetical protein
VTFETLRRRHGLDELDLLVVDTEGHDAAIVGQLDGADVHPRLIVYEHCLLSADDRLRPRMPAVYLRDLG